MSRKLRQRRQREREQKHQSAVSAATNKSAVSAPAGTAEPVTPLPVDSAAPITKAEMRERINEWIESRELLVPPPRPNTFEGVRFRRAVSAGIKAGLLEAAAAPLE
jgi:hypothetical protein